VSRPLFLLDANLLIAFSAPDHIFHATAASWLFEGDFDYATCPITQGALVRFHARLDPANGAANAIAFLQALTTRTGHYFWEDNIPYLHVDPRGIRGHRQVTDAYLAALAVSRGAKLATLDRGLAAWMAHACQLVT
jgi:toxin-antitoxin system PIN domain toxin